MQRKLTEYPRPYLKLTVGPADARNVNGRFRERSKVDRSLRKVLLPHGKLKEGPQPHVKFT